MIKFILALKKIINTAFSFCSVLVYIRDRFDIEPVIKGVSLVNKSDIEDRVLKIKTEMEQTKANFAKLEGHLAEAMHWLEIINQVGAEFEKTMEAENGGKVDSGSDKKEGSTP